MSEKKSKYLSRTVENQNHDRKGAKFGGKNEETPLTESQKFTEAKAPSEDQQLARVVKNISKNPSRTEIISPSKSCLERGNFI